MKEELPVHIILGACDYTKILTSKRARMGIYSKNCNAYFITVDPVYSFIIFMRAVLHVKCNCYLKFCF